MINNRNLPKIFYPIGHDSRLRMPEYRNPDSFYLVQYKLKNPTDYFRVNSERVMFDAIGNKFSRKFVMNSFGGRLFPSFFYNMYLFMSDKPAMENFYELIDRSTYQNTNFQIRQLVDTYTSINFFESDGIDTYNIFTENRIYFDRCSGLLIEILENQDNLIIDFSFKNKQINALKLDPSNLLYYYSTYLFKDPNLQHISGLYTEELISLILKSLYYSLQYLHLLLEEGKKYINRSAQFYKTTKKEFCLTDTYNRVTTNLPTILMILSQNETKTSVLQGFKKSFLKYIYKKFDDTPLLFKTDPNGSKIVKQESLESIRLIIEDWISYWKQKSHKSLSPDEFMYLLSQFIFSNNGFFQLASPPNKQQLNQFYEIEDVKIK